MYKSPDEVEFSPDELGELKAKAIAQGWLTVQSRAMELATVGALLLASLLFGSLVVTDVLLSWGTGLGDLWGWVILILIVIVSLLLGKMAYKDWRMLKRRNVLKEYRIFIALEPDVVESAIIDMLDEKGIPYTEYTNPEQGLVPITGRFEISSYPEERVAIVVGRPWIKQIPDLTPVLLLTSRVKGIEGPYKQHIEAAMGLSRFDHR